MRKGERVQRRGKFLGLRLGNVVSRVPLYSIKYQRGFRWFFASGRAFAGIVCERAERELEKREFCNLLRWTDRVQLIFLYFVEQSNFIILHCSIIQFYIVVTLKFSFFPFLV